MSDMYKRWQFIVSKIQESRDNGNQRALKMWRTKLEKWQQEYGAYAPVGSR
jgi:hypothetical protein